MYAPAPPAPPAVGLTPVELESAALGLASPRMRSLTTAVAVHTTLAVRSATLSVLSGQAARVSGTLRAKLSPEGLPGRLVTLQASDGASWRTVARALTGTGGRFVLRYVPRRIGSERARVRFAGEPYLLSTRRLLGRLDVYRQVEASWYGGGGGLACGGSLTSATMGVASRTLPCRTLVTLRYAGHSVRVPVIDRGPYVSGREFDLTEATKEALGFGDTGQLWSTR